ncbi:MAG: serine/threonine-protein kinase [Kofleriaceae bacterium]
MAVSARIGRYELERPLARGGMAELFVARLVDDAGFARRVAIKRALPELDRDRAFAAMFRDEARLAASLAHHNIVAVHDLGEDSAGFFLVMELLHGADVGALLREAPEPVPLPIVLAIASDACSGLHHAHERYGSDGAPLGIIHRDVSPQNLFVTFDGCTKLLDFGIAKAIDRIGDRATRTGTLRGKVPYMSPEQCRGEPLDRRTDVFSLGIVLWELVTGERLFGALGESDFEVFKQIAERDVPDPSTRRAETPPALARVIMTALARDRAARYPTIAALHDDLDAAGVPATAREVGAYVAARFPERADAWRRGTLVDAPPSPRVTAPLPVATPTRDVTGGETVDFDVPLTRRSPNAASITRVPTPLPIAAPPAWKLPVAIAGVAAALVGGYLIGTRHSEPAAVAAAPSPHPTAVAVDDPQWFQADDYLVSDTPYANLRLDGLRLAKLVGPAPVAGGSAHFVDALGRELETRAYWTTRAATVQDLIVGQLAFCHAQMNTQEGTVPANRDDARLGQWALARITDTAELPARVHVGDAACPLAAVRVPNH